MIIKVVMGRLLGGSSNTTQACSDVRMCSMRLEMTLTAYRTCRFALRSERLFDCERSTTVTSKCLIVKPRFSYATRASYLRTQPAGQSATVWYIRATRSPFFGPRLAENYAYLQRTPTDHRNRPFAEFQAQHYGGKIGRTSD